MSSSESASRPALVFLLDVDNTLFDNDGFATDLSARLTQDFGAAERDRFWSLYERRRERGGYADYLGTLEEFRAGHDSGQRLLQLSAFVLDYPFARHLYQHALETIAHLHTMGQPVILSDGDVVFQPRKVQRSGIWDAVHGRVLIFLHKQLALDAVQRLYPGDHYVMVDDKPQLLDAMKQQMGPRLTTAFVRQGHYARQTPLSSLSRPPDLTLEQISDLLDLDAAVFTGRA
jgi:hypothetical protein